MIALAKILRNPLKTALGAHHLEKQCAFEIMTKLVDAADKDAAVFVEAKFGGKLLSKTNEPEKLQLIKLDILVRL